MRKIVHILWFCILLPAGVFGQEREVSNYGYIDLEFDYDTEEKVSTFDGKHFNLISTYTFDQFRVFAEVEWEHGTVIEDSPEESEGEVALERAWFEYVHSDGLKVRGGGKIPHTLRHHEHYPQCYPDLSNNQSTFHLPVPQTIWPRERSSIWQVLHGSAIGRNVSDGLRRPVLVCRWDGKWPVG